MLPASMRQRPAILQYLLLGLVASLSLLHAVGGGRACLPELRPRAYDGQGSFSSGYIQQTITGTTEESRAAGLKRYDKALERVQILSAIPIPIPPSFVAYNF